MKPKAFELTHFLDSEEMIATYLNALLEEGDEDDLVVAIGHVAKAVGMGKIAQQTGMSRTSLYKAFAEGANPQFQTVLKVLKSLGSEIKVSPIN